jgi:hypothetical protein
MTKIEEPLEKGWLRQVMRDVQDEVAKWPDQPSFPRLGQAEHSDGDLNRMSVRCPNEGNTVCTVG